LLILWSIPLQFSVFRGGFHRGKPCLVSRILPRLLAEERLHPLLELAAKLKQRCGTGGTVKDGRIEIQGDQRERLVVELEKLGYKVKRVGG
jgi:hypothetical protein